MSYEKKIVNAQWILERNLSWIATADVKAGVIITLNIAMLGGLATIVNSVKFVSSWAWVFIAIAASLGVLSTNFTAACLLPRLDGPEKSLIFFGKITDLDRSDYINVLAKVTDQDYFEDLAEQIHRNAEISMTKHMYVKKATIIAFISAVAWVLSILILVIQNNN
jgi:hypothetical protein